MCQLSSNNRRILDLAIPNIISNITIPLLGMVDLALLGHLNSEIYIGAIALGGMIFNFLYWGFSFLRMGTSGFTAQFYGQRNLPATTTVLGRALVVGVGGGLLLVILQQPIAWLSFGLIEGSADVEQLAASYFFIRIWAAPATIGLYALTGWFIGMQNARTPMFIAIIINVLNIIFNVTFVFGFGMKSDGVALGTLLAQYTGFFAGLYFLFRYYKKVLRHFVWRSLFEFSELKRFFAVNQDIFIRTFCLIAVFTFFTSKSAETDDTILAINTLLLQFFTFFSFFMDGFAYAGESLVGKYIGAQNSPLLKRTVRNLFRWGLGITLAVTVVYAAGGNLFLRLLTNSETLISGSMAFFPWVIAIPLAGFASFLWDGIYIGATASKAMRNAMLLATGIVFFPVWLLLSPYIGNHSLWLALVLFLFARGLFQSVMASKAIFSKFPAA